VRPSKPPGCRSRRCRRRTSRWTRLLEGSPNGADEPRITITSPEPLKHVQPSASHSARPASARRGTTRGTKLSAVERTQLNSEHLSELRSPRFGLRTRYRTQEVAGSSPASSTSRKALLRRSFRRRWGPRWPIPWYSTWYYWASGECGLDPLALSLRRLVVGVDRRRCVVAMPHPLLQGPHRYPGPGHARPKGVSQIMKPDFADSGPGRRPP
jgi:hypothetical protein